MPFGQLYGIYLFRHVFIVVSTCASFIALCNSEERGFMLTQKSFEFHVWLVISGAGFRHGDEDTGRDGSGEAESLFAGGKFQLVFGP
jgi:hypothetical protein